MFISVYKSPFATGKLYEGMINWGTATGWMSKEVKKDWKYSNQVTIKFKHKF